MTLKELLDEQEKTFYEKFEYSHERPSLVGKGDAVSFLRQSSIETVKWVMEMIKDKEMVYDTDGLYTKVLLAELNKSIEYHA